MPGQGGGASLLAGNLRASAFGDAPATIDRPATSTADWLHLDGILLNSPYDLNTMGSWGAARIAATGFRYFWILAPNHNSVYPFGLDAETIYVAFANDPAVAPDPATMVPIVSVLGVKQTGTVASFTASVAGDGVTMTVSAIASGIIGLGYNVVGLPVAATISAMVTGKGGAGTYTLSASQGGSVSSGARTCTLPGTQLFNGIYFPWFVYNPDEPGAPGFLYLQCIVTFGINVNAYNTGLWTTADLLTWAFQGISHTNSLGAGSGFTAAQQVYRSGTGSWFSIGSADTGSNDGTKAYWTSTDGRRFAQSSTATAVVGKSSYSYQGGPIFNVSGQNYLMNWEDARGSFWSSGTTYALNDRAYVSTYSGTQYPNAPGGPRDEHYYEFQTYVSLANGNLNHPPASSPAFWQIASDGGQYLAQVAIDATGNLLASPAPSRKSDIYTGTFPGPTYVSSVGGLLEDGIMYSYVLHGFYPALTGATLNQPYTAGGGLYEEYIDVYAHVVDATAAAAAAPPGVKASCANNVVTLTWYDINPGHAYRIYRGTSAGSITTNLGDVSSVASFTDATATPGQVWYYKVVTRNAGVDAGFRVVSTYVGNYSAFTSQHVTRALAAGADPTTINATKIENLIGWLRANGKTQRLMVATAAWMGVVKDGGGVISRIFDLGTTLLSRMGDLTPYDTSASGSTTTYSAVSTGSATSGWVNPNTTSYGMYGNYARGQGFQGRTNPIRRKTALTVVADYNKTGSAALTAIAMGEFNSNFVLQETSGTPGNASFMLADTSTPHTATATLSGSGRHIIAGVYDNAGTITCFAEGVAGTPVSGVANNYVGLGKNNPTQVNYMLSTGSGSSKMNVPADTTVGGTYVWSNAEAKATMHGLFMFDVAFTQAEMTSFYNFISGDASTAASSGFASLRLRAHA